MIADSELAYVSVPGPKNEKSRLLRVTVPPGALAAVASSTGLVVLHEFVARVPPQLTVLLSAAPTRFALSDAPKLNVETAAPVVGENAMVRFWISISAPPYTLSAAAGPAARPSAAPTAVATASFFNPFILFSSSAAQRSYVFWSHRRCRAVRGTT